MIPFTDQSIVRIFYPIHLSPKGKAEQISPAEINSPFFGPHQYTSTV